MGQTVTRLWNLDSQKMLLKGVWTWEYPLHEAVFKHNLSMLQLLLQQSHNIDINKQNAKGETALLLAIKLDRSKDIIECLLNAGCDATIAEGNGRTPLHEAVRLNLIEIMCMLIKKGADVNAKDNREVSPLSLAIWRNNLESTNLLLSCGAEGYYEGCMETEMMSNDCNTFINQINKKGLVWACTVND